MSPGHVHPSTGLCPDKYRREDEHHGRAGETVDHVPAAHHLPERPGQQPQHRRAKIVGPYTLQSGPRPGEDR